MKTVTLHDAITDLTAIINSTLKNQEETVIATDNGAVVMISQENWEDMKETLMILKDKKSLSALIQGHQNRDIGTVKGKNVGEVFNDL